jgi:hypothetical protein
MQYSLRTVLFVTAVCSIASAVVRHLGWDVVMPAVVALVFATVWAFIFNLAPDATKCFTSIAVIALLLFSLFSVGVLRARENARHNRCIHNMLQHGQNYQVQGDLHRNEAGKQECQEQLNNEIGS